jgi:signal transduction histidine kinase
LGAIVDEMSSERFRERLLSGDQPGLDSGKFGLASAGRPAAAVRPQLQTEVADVPLPPSARWNPRNWRLRTKLIALAVLPMLAAIVLGALRIADSARSSDAAAVRDAVIIGVVLLAALILLVIVARSILKPLRVLRASAFDVADRRLPGVIEQLRAPEGRESDIRVEPVPVYSREDVGQVARAFDAVHSEAVRLAAEQAALRANVNDMFINLSRRSQGLVERQLRLIDELELGEQDSDRLAALFRLDHLATRMRRNGENLLVLAGAELRQRSGEPVPIVDVLRAAVSEIEDYQRVEMQTFPRALISGLAVNDIVHLVAELLDNATAYSDPESQVRLSANYTEEGGLAVEIADAGAGLQRHRLVEINQRLATPPAVDVSVSRQMGLFVVGRLANQHGIAVYLASPDDSGVTVTVTLPRELMTTESTGIGGRSDYLGRSSPQPIRVSAAASAQAGELFQRGAATSPDVHAQFAESLPSQRGLLDDLPSLNSKTEDTPIFHAMLSRWFAEGQREQQPTLPLDVTQAAPAPEPAVDEDEGWESEADVGWRAAEAASEPTVDEVTAAGLPKRRPQAFLVPGSAAPTGTTNGQSAPPAARDAYAVRGRMSSFQRGLDLGRHGRPTRTADEVGAGRHSRDENTAEGNQ